MYLFSFTLKMEAGVVCLKCLGNLLQNVVSWKEIVFRYIVLFLFLRDAELFISGVMVTYLVITTKMSLMASSSKVWE